MNGNTSDETVLEFDAVSKWYGPVIGLNQVSIQLKTGITGLVGSNGAGKSTLLRLATGQLKPSIGRVLVHGQDAWSWQAKALVGYCPDNDAFYEDMTGREFVRSMAMMCGFTSNTSRTRTEEVLTRVGMVDRADRKIRGYSKGMRQRVKLAQALLNDPKLLVLDEPLSGIDPIGRQEMLELFRALASEGKCLLISSHELEELEKLTDHVAILARGRIAALGTVSSIRDLLDDMPLTIRIDSGDTRMLAGLLLTRPEVVGVDFPNPGTLIVRARNPRRFFEEFNEVATNDRLAITRLEPLDDSTHAVLGYLLGGSGKT